jgi:hypothetical protein
MNCRELANALVHGLLIAALAFLLTSIVTVG